MLKKGGIRATINWLVTGELLPQSFILGVCFFLIFFIWPAAEPALTTTTAQIELLVTKRDFMDFVFFVTDLIFFLYTFVWN